MGPKGAEWKDSYCTGTGDDQVFYDEGKITTGLSSSIEFNIDLGPGDDRVTVLSRPSWEDWIQAGPGDDTIIFGPKSWARVPPGPGDDLIRGPTSRGGRRTHVHRPAVGRQVRSGSTWPADAQRARDTTDFPRTPDAPSADGSTTCCSAPPETTNSTPGYGADLVRAGAGDDDVCSGWTWYCASPWRRGRSDLSGTRGRHGGRRPRSRTGCTEGRAPTPSQVASIVTTSMADPVTTTYIAASAASHGRRAEPPPFLSEVCFDAAPNEVFGRSGNDLLSGDLGNDRLDGGPGFDSGSGGYHDGRIDWITSVERPVD